MKPLRRTFRRTNQNQFLIPIGWLFADLLLMLAMLFLIASTGYIPKQATPTVPPSPTAVLTKPTPVPIKPTVIQQPSLDLNPIQFNLTNVDYVTLLSNHPQGAIIGIQNQVKAQKLLWGRRAALVLAFGVANNVNQIGTANQVSESVYQALQGLGKTQEIVVGSGTKISFWQTRYYKSPLHDIDPTLSLSTVELVIYCFSKSDA